MYDFHIHSLHSDGVLLPSEIAARYLDKGYKAIAITDHCDYSNIEQVTGAILKFTDNWPKSSRIKIFPGVELTHLPPEQFKPLVKLARSKGIKVIIGHGQTTSEPVIKGTNKAALEADVNILAHPGMITDDEVKLAKKKGIFLEISARQAHSSTNNHVAGLALKHKAKLILNSDSHLPEDILEPFQFKKIAFDAGLSEEDLKNIYHGVEEFIKERGGRK